MSFLQVGVTLVVEGPPSHEGPYVSWPICKDHNFVVFKVETTNLDNALAKTAIGTVNLKMGSYISCAPGILNPID